MSNCNGISGRAVSFSPWSSQDGRCPMVNDQEVRLRSTLDPPVFRWPSVIGHRGSLKTKQPWHLRSANFRPWLLTIAASGLKKPLTPLKHSITLKGGHSGGLMKRWSCSSRAFLPISSRRFPPLCEGAVRGVVLARPTNTAFPTAFPTPSREPKHVVFD